MMLELKHITLAVALKCNLRCRLCLTASPYYDNPPIYPYDLLAKTTECLFQTVDYVKKLTLTGGEPLLNKSLAEFIVHLKKYESHIGEIEIITNGTIVPNDTLVEACKSFCNLSFLVDDYGNDISVKAKAIVRKLSVAGITVRHRIYYGKNAHLGGWVDFGDLSYKHIDAEASELYRNCAYSRADNVCFGIYGGKVSLCSVSRRCSELSITNECNILDLLNDTLPIEEKKRWFIHSVNWNKLDACNYCNGMCSNSARFPAGEQISVKSHKE